MPHFNVKLPITGHLVVEDVEAANEAEAILIAAYRTDAAEEVQTFDVMYHTELLDETGLLISSNPVDLFRAVAEVIPNVEAKEI